MSSAAAAKRPFLTIGIASYNYGSYLPHALEQIKKQTFTDYEVLYCDDGSTDDSVARIRGFIRDNPQMTIRLIEGENGGILANKNRILENARGEYLMICDADDYMLDGCLESLCAAARAGDADCVIGGFDEVDGDGRLLKRHVPPQNASKWLYTWHHAQIYRLQPVRDHGVAFTELPDDVFFLQTLHRYCRSVRFVRAACYAWVRHGDSTSRATAEESDWSPVRIWGKLATFLAGLRDELAAEDAGNEKDVDALDYYLCKWFYFNVLDLPLQQYGSLKRCIATMQAQMRAACPRSAERGAWSRLAHAPDTAFARTAVILCRCAERCRLLPLLVLVRNLQYRVRG